MVEVCDACCFGFSTAVREEDERDVVLVEVSEGCCGTGERSGGTEEDTVNVEGESDVCSLRRGDGRRSGLVPSSRLL